MMPHCGAAAHTPIAIPEVINGHSEFSGFGVPTSFCNPKKSTKIRTATLQWCLELTEPGDTHSSLYGIMGFNLKRKLPV